MSSNGAELGKDGDSLPSMPTPDAWLSPPPFVLGRGAARLIALAVSLAVLFAMLTKSGIWDPYELDSADLARRIAIRVFGAENLELPNASNALPTLSDLKMGELPFTSMALGFHVFGLHDWVGRLPLAVWALAGAASLYAMLERLVDRRAALYSVLALVTMPLFFMQARTMLGDAVTMAALTMAFSGLVGAVFDDASEGVAPRFAWLLLGLFGLAAGYLCRGLLIGVAVPALGVGVAWAISRSSGLTRGAASAAIGVVTLAIGLSALGFAIALFLTTPLDAPLKRAIGFALLRRPPLESTFDLTIRQLGHALFPWSAFVPIAIGRLLRAPPAAGRGDRAVAREGAVRLSLLVGAALAYGAFALAAPGAGNLAFSAPALFAAMAGLSILDFERGAPPSRALGLATGLLALVLLSDFLHEPEKALAAFVVDKPSYPKSFEASGARMLWFSCIAFVAPIALAWFEEQPPSPSPSIKAWARDLLERYREGFALLGDVWQGNLGFALVVCEAALVGLGAMVFVGRHLAWTPVERMPKRVADYGLMAWWAAPLVVASTPFLLVAARDGFRWLCAATRTSRAVWTLVAGLAAGSMLSFGYYPALAAQLSPKEVFEAYAHVAGAGEPLALLNVRARAASYYAGGDVESFTDATRAFAWLTEEPTRRFLVVKADDLPKVNALHRTAFAKNLPVIDARSSQILLASNQLAGAPNENSLGSIALDEPPQPSHLVDAEFEDQLQTLGWDVIEKGAVVDSVVPSTPYKLRIYYRVLRPIAGSWKAFLHIDGQQRRFNGDHAVCDGRYPMNLWQPGDIIADELEFQLEPNFTPGAYTVYFGFFTGETRLRVASGPEQENRVIGGTIRVR